MNLSTPIAELPRIGAIYQRRLKKLGIKTIRDLLLHFPHRYEDFSNIIPISEVGFNKDCCIRGKILGIENTRTWRKRMILTQAIVEDKSGAIKIVWFNQPYLIRVLKKGDNVCLAGRAVLGTDGLYLTGPAYEKLSQLECDRLTLVHTGRIVPIYPETEGLSSRWLRYILKPLILEFKNRIPDPLPRDLITNHQLLPLQKALWQVHFPDSIDLAERARYRFAFEELFNLSIFVLKERVKLNQERSPSIPLNLEFLQNFVKSLPFKLTDAQKKCAWQILKDLERPRPMNRLLEGDVGSGKTVVAAIAALSATKAGYQTAFMAPTEILAKQHFKTVWDLLKNFNLNIGLLTGKEDKFFSKKLKNQVIEISRKKLLEKAKKGEIDILIGTHALISPSAPPKRRSYGGPFVAPAGRSEGGQVRFKNLALVIVDEQHRFGVEQRAKLCQPSPNCDVLSCDCKITRYIPHLLSMTATPIPRTLALTIYGDLDLSLITELPKGRKKIITKIVAPAEREKAYNFIRKEVEKGRQVFVICPRIEGGGKDVLGWAEVKAVKEEYERLSKNVFPDLKVGMLHGKMASREKEKIMQDFKNEKIDVLVSTSVIEVGIDVPNATVMMIEGAERFGLAQLYQFRGRVGRASFQSSCFLFTDSPAKKTHQRLKALITCENGFELAEKDLQIRGPGDFSGTRQWGIPDLVMSSLSDVCLIEKTRQAAKEILTEDPELKKYPLLQERLKRFRERIHFE